MVNKEIHFTAVIKSIASIMLDFPLMEGCRWYVLLWCLFILPALLNVTTFGPQQAHHWHRKGDHLKLHRSKLCSFSNWPPLTAKPKLWELVGLSSPESAACTSECLWDANIADCCWCSYLILFSRMRKRDLQSLCRRTLLLTVCMVSLWGQLASASSHRSHIGTPLHVFLSVIFSRASHPE